MQKNSSMKSFEFIANQTSDPRLTFIEKSFYKSTPPGDFKKVIHEKYFFADIKTDSSSLNGY